MTTFLHKPLLILVSANEGGRPKICPRSLWMALRMPFIPSTFGAQWKSDLKRNVHDMWLTLLHTFAHTHRLSK